MKNLSPACGTIRVSHGLLLILSLLGSSLPFALQANTYNVTNTADGTGTVTLVSGSTYNASTLRAAVNAANAAAGPHTVNIPSGTYNLTLGELQVGTNANFSITLNGTSTPANTVIQHDTSGTAARVFDLDPALLGGVNVTFQNLTIAHGRDNSGLGGAGIISGYQGPPAADSTILSNCVVSDNLVISNLSDAVGGGIQNIGGTLKAIGCVFGGNADTNFSGGAIYYESHSPSTGTFQVVSCTFSNNLAGDIANGGGAIFVSGVSGSSLSISNSTFIGNKVVSTNGSGGAIIKFGTAPLTISTCLFLTNQVLGTSATSNNASGGAIDNAGGPMTLVYSRLFGNTSAVAGHGNAVNNATSAGATLVADNNWWGLNNGPGAGLAGGAVANWLKLTHTANPNAINPSNSTTLTATVLTNSAGATVPLANLSLLLGLPITFGNAVKGTLTGAQPTIQPSGTATATFTAGALPGAASADATVDNATATAAITVICPTITATASGGATICAGNSATVSVTVSGGASPYTVTLNNGGGTKTNASPVVLTVTPSSTTIYSIMSATDSNGCTATVSGSATINVNPAPTATITPNPISVCPSSSGNQASGPAGLTKYAWTIANGTITGPTNGQTITYNAGAAGNVTLALAVTSSSGCGGNSVTNIPISAPPGPVITPSPLTVCAGSFGNHASAPAGSLSYAWTIANGTIFSATNSPTITYTAGSAGSVTLALTVATSGGCISGSSTNITINPLPATPLIAASSSSVCADSPGNQASGPGGAAGYLWTILNGTFTSAANLPTVTFVAGASGNVILGLTVSNAAGCTASASTNVLIIPPPTTPLGCSLRTNYFPSLLFNDALAGTTMTIAFDGSSYWTCSGGSSAGVRYARYDANGVLLSTYSPGLDFRSVFTDGSCAVLARAVADPTIYRQSSPGVFVPSGVVLTGGSLDTQSSVVLNGAATEYIAMSAGGVVSRWDTAGSYLGSVNLTGFGVLAGENLYPQNRGISAFGDYWLTYNGTNTVSVWDTYGNRLAKSTLSSSGTNFDSQFSFSFANGKVFMVSVADGVWRGFDVCSRGRVAVYGSPGGGAAWNTDVQNKIAAAGLIPQVDAFLVSGGNPVPTLADFRRYESVLVYSDQSFNSNTIVGNNLADYVDLGGGVTLSTFAYWSSGGLSIQGRLVTGGYLPFTTASQAVGSDLTLVKVVPAHPLLVGVNSFDGGSASYQNSSITTVAGATLVAQWSNGQPLVAARDVTAGRIAGLNFYPPSSDAAGGLWLANTDGARLMANALLWSGKVPPVILAGPSNRVANIGTSVVMAVNAVSGNLAYQWRKDGTNIAGATNSSLPVNAQPATFGTFSVVVSNAYGVALSSKATLSPILRFLPPVVQAGGSLPLFLATVDGSPIPPQRAARVSLYSSTNVSLAFSNWTLLPNPLVLSSGLIRVDNLNAPSTRTFFRATEIP